MDGYEWTIECGERKTGDYIINRYVWITKEEHSVPGNLVAFVYEMLNNNVLLPYTIHCLKYSLLKWRRTATPRRAVHQLTFIHICRRIDRLKYAWMRLRPRNADMWGVFIEWVGSTLPSGVNSNHDPAKKACYMCYTTWGFCSQVDQTV